MQNRLIRTATEFTRINASRSAAWAVVTRDTLSGLFMTARHTVMLIGFLAIVATAVFLTKPEAAERALAYVTFSKGESTEEEPLKVATMTQLTPFANQASMTTVSLDDTNLDVQRQQQRITNWISRRYRVASDATEVFVNTAYQTAIELKLDPLLILSVMAIESRFNPFAESPAGAQGLMQVMSRVHKDKFEELGGIEAALNPIANIKVGSRILKEYVRRGGSVEAGLKMYVGAAALDTDFGYGAKVLGEYARMREVATGKKVSIYASTRMPPKPATIEPTPGMQEAKIELEQSPQPPSHIDQIASAL